MEVRSSHELRKSAETPRLSCAETYACQRASREFLWPITYAIESTKFSNLDYKNCSMHAPSFYPVKISESLPWSTWKADICASSLAILTEVQYLNSKNRHMFECIGGLEHLHSWDYNTINHVWKVSR